MPMDGRCIRVSTPISTTTTTSANTALWTNEHPLRYSWKELSEHDCTWCRRCAPPSALRASPSGTGYTPRRHQERAARWPPEHGTRTCRFHLKIAGPWSKIGGRRSGAIQGPIDGYLKHGFRSASSEYQAAVQEYTRVARVTLATHNLKWWWDRWHDQVKNDCTCLYMREKKRIKKWQDHWKENDEVMIKALRNARNNMGKW